MKSSTTPDFWAAYQVLPERVRNLAEELSSLAGESGASIIALETARARAVVNPCRVAISRAGACAQWHRQTREANVIFPAKFSLPIITIL
jgi:hypothetical protein